MRRFFCALLAAALLTLSGCGKTNAGEAGLLERASGLAPDKTVLTADGRDIPAWQVLYWLAQGCGEIAAQCEAAGAAPDWESARSGGQTLGGQVKSQALRTAVLYGEIAVWAERYGCALTEADRALIESEWPEGARQEELSALGLRTEDARWLCGIYCLYSHLLELFRTEGSALCPAAGAASAYLAENGAVTVSLLTIAAEPSDPELWAQGRARAEQARERLLACEAPAGEFSALGGELGAVSDVTFLPGGGALEESLERVAQALAEGALSTVLETEGGFVLLLRRPLAEAADSLYFDHLLQTAADGAQVTFTRAYDKIDAGAFYANLTEARMGADAAAASGA